MHRGTKLNEVMCGKQPKPTATQHCEITTDCKWKAGPWKPVSYLKICIFSIENRNFSIEINLILFYTVFM